MSWFSKAPASTPSAAPETDGRDMIPGPSSSSSPSSSTPAPSSNSLNSKNPIQVSDEVFTNPYYPLSGPPRTDAEKALLDKIITEERATMTSAMSSAMAARKQNRLKIDEVAKANCADVYWDLHLCMKSWTFSGLAGLCFKERDKIEECIGLQRRFLKELGYASLKTVLTDREQTIVADRADQMYLKEMRRRREEAAGDAKKEE